MTMKDELDRVGPVVDRLNAAIRENPLAAGLIGAGVAWMFLGGTKGVGMMAGTATTAVRKTGSVAAAAGSAVAGSLAAAGSNIASGVKEAGARAADAVTSIVPELPETPEPSEAKETVDAASSASSGVGDRISSVAASGREYGAAIQSRLSEGLERQPLLLGAIGLAIGAGIASTFATTAIEGELMGEQGTVVRGKLRDLADEAKDRANQVVANVQEEADREGLTANAAKNAVSGMADKVKTVAGAGRDSLAQSSTRPRSKPSREGASMQAMNPSARGPKL
jgi:hypothetical protein